MRYRKKAANQDDLSWRWMIRSTFESENVIFSPRHVNGHL